MYTEKSLKKMVELAKGVMANAYVPILEFKVGSCLMTEEGKFFSGCNWEMGATPLSQCAESCAISSMISHGYRKISHIVVMAEKVQICPPCGACRQKIHEFSAGEAIVIMCNKDGEVKREERVDKLLPCSFVF